MKRTLVVTVFGLLISMALPAAARRWTSADGRFTTDADLVEFVDGKVTLKKRSGETIVVPLEQLSEMDRRWVQSPKKKPTATKAAPKPNVIGYVKDIQPFLEKYCMGCHSPGNAKDGYDVTTFAALTRSGKKGAMVVPGNPAASRLILTIQGKGKPMPPKEYPQPPADEVAKVSAWIQAGALDDTTAPPPNTAPGKGKVLAGKK